MERTRILRAEHKVIAKNLNAKKKQNEIQENIAETERNTKEALEKVELPPLSKERMDKNATAATASRCGQIPRR